MKTPITKTLKKQSALKQNKIEDLYYKRLLYKGRAEAKRNASRINALEQKIQNLKHTEIKPEESESIDIDQIINEIKERGLDNPLVVKGITLTQIIAGDTRADKEYARKINEKNLDLLKDFTLATKEIAQNTKQIKKQDTKIKKPVKKTKQKTKNIEDEAKGIIASVKDSSDAMFNMLADKVKLTAYNMIYGAVAGTLGSKAAGLFFSKFGTLGLFAGIEKMILDYINEHYEEWIKKYGKKLDKAYQEYYEKFQQFLPKNMRDNIHRYGLDPTKRTSQRDSMHITKYAEKIIDLLDSVPTGKIVPKKTERKIVSYIRAINRILHKNKSKKNIFNIMEINGLSSNTTKYLIFIDILNKYNLNPNKVKARQSLSGYVIMNESKREKSSFDEKTEELINKRLPNDQFARELLLINVKPKVHSAILEYTKIKKKIQETEQKASRLKR